MIIINLSDYFDEVSDFVNIHDKMKFDKIINFKSLCSNTLSYLLKLKILTDYLDFDKFLCQIKLLT